MSTERLFAAIRALPEGRNLVALAGPPAAGKSTFAEALAAALPSAAIVPMDGFHYDDAVLHARGLRHLKGAPETFDLGGLAHLLARLAANAEPEIAVPVFDRDLELSRGSARIVPQSIRTVIVEGNWLLLDRPGWRDLRRHFALTVSIAPAEELLRERLTARWAGFGLSAEAMAAQIDGNDLPNARTVLTESIAADEVIRETGPLTPLRAGS